MIILFKMILISRIIFTSLLVVITLTSSGQTLKLDSNVTEAMNYQKVQYTERIGQRSRLFNGVDYREEVLHEFDKGHPFFQSTEWGKGIIVYNNQRYDNVDLLYDITQGKVVTHQYKAITKIALISENISSFDISDHHFISITQNDSLGGILPPGFYEQLNAGMVALYVHRKKEIFRDLHDIPNIVVINYLEKDSYYIIRNSKAFLIENKSDLFRVLGDKKALIRNQLLKRNILFREDREAALILAVSTYNGKP